jgi:hypothetical protein
MIAAAGRTSSRQTRIVHDVSPLGPFQGEASHALMCAGQNIAEAVGVTGE